MDIAAPRSTFITLLAWIGIVFSALLLPVVLVQWVLFKVMVTPEVLDETLALLIADAPALAVSLVKHLDALLLAILLSLIAGLVGFWGLLKRREWARWLVIALLALTALLNLAGLALPFLALGESAGPGPASPTGITQGLALVQSVLLLAGVALSLAVCAIHGWLIWKLSRPEIHSEFR